METEIIIHIFVKIRTKKKKKKKKKKRRGKKKRGATFLRKNENSDSLKTTKNAIKVQFFLGQQMHIFTYKDHILKQINRRTLYM